MKITISIKSDQLDAEALRVLLQAIRTCEMSHFPTKLINISIVAPEMSTEEMKTLLTGIEPPYDVGPIVLELDGGLYLPNAVGKGDSD